MKPVEMTPQERKTTSTAFILMFPALIIAAIATYYAPLGASFISIAIAVYQFLMLRKFVEDYFKK